jgi:hypothetical protein
LDPHPDHGAAINTLARLAGRKHVVAIRIVAYDQIAPADWLCTT